MRHYRWFLWLVLGLAGALASGCGNAATPAPVVQTVIQTVAVEVTRNIEVTRVLEVTRDVVVTQVVELPVTVTPSLPTAKATIPAQSQPATPLANLTPQATPDAKYQGFTPVFVQNKTSDKLDVFLAGPDEFNLALWGGDQQKIWVSEGNYTYTVWTNGQEAYHGKLKIVSADKYNWLLYEKKAVLWIP
jgi:hypothetical protein